MPVLRFAFCLLIAVVVCGEPVYAQDTTNAAMDESAAVQRVEMAFADGTAESLLDPSTDRVEISKFGTRTFYSRAQALYVLRDFFKAHPPKRFEREEIVTAGTSFFVTGRYWHVRAEDPLRIYVRLTEPSGNANGGQAMVWRLQEVRIERLRR